MQAPTKEGIAALVDFAGDSQKTEDRRQKLERDASPDKGGDSSPGTLKSK